MEREKKEIIRARLERLKQEAPDLELMKMGVEGTFSVDDVIRHVEEDTDLGKKFAKAEEKMLDRTLKKEKEALG